MYFNLLPVPKNPVIMNESTTQCDLPESSPTKILSRSVSTRRPDPSEPNSALSPTISGKQPIQQSIDIDKKDKILKLPKLQGQGQTFQRSESDRKPELSNFGNSVSEIKYPLFRSKSRKLPIPPSERPVVVSNQNRRLIQSFLQKLNLVENYALKDESISQEYIDLIYQLNRKETEYSEMISRREKTFTTAQEQELLHSSPTNKKINSELIEDLRKVRSFAFKHQFPLHRKDICSNSRELTQSQDQRLEIAACSKIDRVHSRRKKQKVQLPNEDLQKLQNQQGINNSGSGKIQQTPEVATDIFRSLKIKRRDSLPLKERYRLGVGYLASKGRGREKGEKQKKEERGKMRLIKEVLHHWMPDNRYLKVSTEFDQQEENVPIRLQNKFHGKQSTVKNTTNKDISS